MARRRRKEAGFVPIFRARVLYKDVAFTFKDVAFTFSVSTNRAEYSTSQLSGLPMHKCPATPEDINSPTHPLKKLIHSKGHPLERSPTQKLTNSSTPKLKNLIFILQCYSNSRAILAKMLVKK